MGKFIARDVEREYNANGLTAAQAIYRAYFITITTWAAYKAACDAKLTADGRADCIVTA